MKKAFAALAALALCLMCGCTVSHGVFVGMNQHSGGASLGASYASFDGSIERRVALKEGDVVTFSLEGGEGLRASVKQDGGALFGIEDGAAFTAPSGGTYAFVVEGQAKNGAFTLSWRIT